jgi:hypothetical protein
MPVLGRTAATSDSSSLRRAKVTPETSGSNGSFLPGCPVAESAPNVRPWNEPSSATTPCLPVALRANFIAASFASAPELQKNAWAPPKRADRRSASPAIGSVQYRFETCQSRSSWA